MRTFLGIRLPAEWSDALSHAASVGFTSDDPALSRARWVPPERLHLTLRFLGEVEDWSIDPLRHAVADTCRNVEPFELPLDTAVSAVPSARRAKMLWGVLGDPRGDCSILVDRLSAAVAGFGIAPEPRPFVPHVTLARLRRPTAIHTDLLEQMNAEVEAGFIGLGTYLSVHRVTLFSSTLTRDGAIYSHLWEEQLGSR